MTYKALIFGTKNTIRQMTPYYEQAVWHGNIEIVSHVFFEKDGTFVTADGTRGELPYFDLAIVSSKKNLYQLTKRLEAHGIPRDKIIDGRVFETPHLDFPRFLKEGIAYGILEEDTFDVSSRMIYPQVYKTKDEKITLSLGTKSCIRAGGTLTGKGVITLEKFSSFAPDITFNLGANASHNYLNVSTVPLSSLDWAYPKEFWPSRGTCKVLIGNDVWCGRKSVFKSVNPAKPLVIGDGAVIASNSVVVKSVPPYAIVGGNPAQIIKYRFEPHIIDALLRIKWWDWDIDKIHDNFKYFNDIEKFIALHDN